MISLGDYCEFVNGGAWKQDEYDEVGHPVVQVSNIKSDTFELSGQKFLRHESFERYKKHQIRNGDLIIATVGSHPSQPSAAGRAAVANEKIDGMLLNQNAVLIRSNSPDLVQGYLCLIGRSPDFQHFVQHAGKGAANQVRIAIGAVKSFEFELPSTEQQIKTAQIIEAYDDLIENNRRRIALLEQAARLLYREWFVHFRFPGHETAKFVDGLPEGWESKQVKDLLSRLKAKPKVRKDEYETTGLYPCVDQGQSFVGGYTDKHEAIYRDELPLIVFGDHTRSLKYIDFPFARGADGTQIIQSNHDRLSQPLFYFALINVDLSNYAYARHFKFLKDQEIIIPDEAVGLKFTEVVEDSFAQIKNLRGQIDQLTSARDLLLPRLMDGRLPV